MNTEAAAQAILRGLGHGDTITEPTQRSCMVHFPSQREPGSTLVRTATVGEILDALQAAGYQLARPGSVAGWVVARAHAGRLRADWDVEIHATVEAGQEACADANAQCPHVGPWRLYALREATLGGQT